MTACVHKDQKTDLAFTFPPITTITTISLRINGLNLIKLHKPHKYLSSMKALPGPTC